MAKLVWDQISEKLYETGVDHGVLYLPDNTGKYAKGVAWNGLTAVNESPEGADATDLYANNAKYLSLIATETYGCTIEAYTYPDEFEQCDGSAELTKGVHVGQQTRKPFGFTFRNILGNDTEGDAYGYKITCVYGCKASPSSKDHATVNDSPEAVTFSWEVSTTPVPVTGFKPTATITINSTKVDPEKLKAFEDILYGSEDAEARLPLPDEIFELFKETPVVGG